MKHILIITSIFISLIIIATTAQTTWTKISTTGFNWDGMHGLTYGNNEFIGVETQIYKSADNGATWQVYASGTTKVLNGIVYGNGLFVAVGDTGTILTSSNGITWTQRTSGTKRCFRNVAYGNSQYVAVGDSGTILTSPDGTTWTQRTSGTTYGLYGITFGSSQFVISGKVGNVLTSPNGITWTIHSAGTPYTFFNVAFGNNTYVVVGPGESGTTNTVVYTSPDGFTWTNRTGQGITGYQYCYAITYGAGHFVAATNYGIFTSTTSGVYWTQVQSNSSGVLLCAAYGNNTFIVGGTVIYTSPAVNAIRYTTPKAGKNQLLTITNNTARFTLTQAANANLTLFDLNGRAVALLVKGQKAAGMYKAALPANLPQGRYVLSLKAGEASCVTPVMITR